MAAKKAIGELLVKENVINITQLEQAKKAAKKQGSKLTSTLVSLGYVNETDLAEFLGTQYNLPTINLHDFECEEDALSALTGQICKKYVVIPVSKADSTLVVAFADPTNIYVKDDLALLTRCKIEPVVASEVAIHRAIEKYYNVSGADYGNFANIMSEMEDEDEYTSAGKTEAIELAQADGDNGPIVKFVSAMLAEAIKLKASDIHIEPYEHKFRIRFRIDGRLMQKTQPPPGAASAIVSRIKILAQLNIAERRKPQDGRLKVKMANGQAVDFRVSILPVLFGEKVVLRLLDKSNLQIDMTKLGFEEHQLDMLLKSIHLPQGMVLITGPTGSGKTTTIYSCLSELNEPESNLSTAEDPVEFNLEGINQVQVKAEIGFGFAEALRSFLRQDPDIVMVGEIRDLETANVAYKAASTGHLVVSTLHTNDAASTVSRLLDMGVPHFMVAEATSLIVAQRLIRTNCKHCLVEVNVPNQTLLELGIPEERLPEFASLKKGQGCSECNSTGLAGRMAVHEVLKISAPVKQAIFKSASPLEIKKQAIDAGMMSLRMSAIEKLKRGLTTVEQVMASTVADDVL